ncbi:hypothetical protein AB0N14_13650 [Streptomyces sp. NPDC051104]|uniref:hypothetical protein n=1 Tax=Streptomyces sp. NPDC051104 TaxID=3155044 RepID=UPI00343F3347
MTAAARRPLVRVTARTVDILRRCYRGEIPEDVLEQAAVLKATADGLLGADGRPKSGRRT